MAARIIFILLVAAALANSSRAQEETRASITIEAEIIQALGTGGGQATTGPGTVGTQTAAGTAAQQAAADPSATPPTPTTESVASSLLQSAQIGDLSVADTALVAGLQAGRRTNRQNLQALVTVTFVDEFGNITSTTMRTTDVTADIFGLRTDASTVITEAPPTAAGALLGGDTMRRNPGERYFYVQVCSCGV